MMTFCLSVSQALLARVQLFFLSEAQSYLVPVWLSLALVLSLWSSMSCNGCLDKAINRVSRTLSKLYLSTKFHFHHCSPTAPQTCPLCLCTCASPLLGVPFHILYLSGSHTYSSFKDGLRCHLLMEPCGTRQDELVIPSFVLLSHLIWKQIIALGLFYYCICLQVCLSHETGRLSHTPRTSNQTDGNEFGGRCDKSDCVFHSLGSS